MRRDVYWHIYGQDQIKVSMRGNLVYLLEVPLRPGVPVIREVFDPNGTPSWAFQGIAVPRPSIAETHGIIYQGVSKTAIYDLVASDPPVMPLDSQFYIYNRKIISNARNQLLTDPNAGFDLMPADTLRLVCGSVMFAGSSVSSN